MKVSSELYLNLIGCHINILDNMTIFLRRETRSEFYVDITLLA